MHNAVEWSMVMSRGQEERSQMHAMSLLFNTCSGMTNRVLIDDGARWILHGEEQERENRTAGVKALYSMPASTTSGPGRAKKLVKKGLIDRNGMIAFGKVRERFGRTAVVAKLSDVFQFQWTSPDSLEDKWLRWQRLMRQVSMTSLGDSWDTHDCWSGESQGTMSGTTPTSACSTNLDRISTCERRWTRAVGPRQRKLVSVMSTCACCGKAGHEKARCRFRNAKCSNCGKTGHLKAMCRQREKSAGKSSPSSSSGKGGTTRQKTDKCNCYGQVGHATT